MTIDIGKVTDAQAAEIMLTLPWRFGDVNEDGEASYSGDEIQTVIGYVRKCNARMEAAEAECAKWRELHADRDHDLKHEYQHAETTEAELLLVRETLAVTLDERDEALAEAETLRVAYEVAQDEAYRLANNAEAAESEVKRLSAALAACQQSEAYARAEMARLQRLVNQTTRKT